MSQYFHLVVSPPPSIDEDWSPETACQTVGELADHLEASHLGGECP